MTEQRRLPPGYYLDHFMQVLQGVATRYAFLLSEAELGHIARLENLTPPARMLYARLVNRRGPCFRVRRLAYPEIPLLEGAVAELLVHGLLAPCGGGDDGGPLECFTQAELRRALRGHGAPARPRKPELLAWLAAWDGRQAWLSALLRDEAVVRIPDSDPWPFLRFLFFGELRDNLADFVTRALGHIVTESFAPPLLAPQFSARREAEDAYRMACLYVAFRQRRAALPPAEVFAWWRARNVERESLAAGQPWFDRLADRLGKILEQAGMTEAALTVYAGSPMAPARERRARLLLKCGRREEALALLQAMHENPCGAEEAYAARQLLARLTRNTRRSEARFLERAGRALILEHAGGNAEDAVLAHYRALGWQGVHAENWLWNASFGLLLWDIIYDPGLGVFHSPVQFAPSDLNQPAFYGRRRAAIEARLETLARPAEALAVMRGHLDLKFGLANPFVAWHDGLAAIMEVMLRRLPAAGHAAALRRIAQDFARHARGLPDLFLWTETDYQFIEIKTENDHLAPHQYEWIRFLREAGVKVALERLRKPAR